MTPLRHTVASRARRAGLSGERLDDFVAAVNELITNAVRHGGGAGFLELCRAEGEVVCTVTDHGAGMPAGAAFARPAPRDPGGRGLWLAAQLTDTIKVISGNGGTAVRISTRVG